MDDGTFTSTWDIDTDPAEIVGTGPFTIERYEPGERVVMRRNPSYWFKDDAGNSLPYLDEIVHVIVPDLETELEKFLVGEADVHGVLGEEYAQLESLQEDGNFTIYRRGPAFGTTFLVFNMNPGKNPNTGEPYVAPEKLAWFRSKQFRQAVAYSIDKDTIINDVQHGLGYPQWASISPAAGDFYNSDVRRYEYGVDRANEILDGIGWTDTDGDGVREDSEGNDIEFSLITNTGNTVRVDSGNLGVVGAPLPTRRTGGRGPSCRPAPPATSCGAGWAGPRHQPNAIRCGDRSPSGGRSPTTTGPTPPGTASAVAGSRRGRRGVFCCDVCAVEAWRKRSQSTTVGPLLCGRRDPIPVWLIPRDIQVPDGVPASPVHTSRPFSLPATDPAR